jgi:hypothetical protein
VAGWNTGRGMVGGSRRIWPGLGALAAASALSGCGGSGHPLKSAIAAAEKTLAQNAVGTVSLGGTAGQAAGRVGFVFPRALGAQILHTRTGTAYFLFTPAAVYVDPVDRTGLAPATTWVSIPVGSALGATLGGLNAQLLLEEVAWGGVSAVPLGQKVISHAPYVEYRVTVDLRRALARARGPAKAALTAAVRAELAAGGTRRATVALWVDGPGRVAQVAGAVAGSRLGTVTTSLSAFGIKIVEVSPKPSQVVALAKLPPRAGSSWVFGASGS